MMKKSLDAMIAWLETAMDCGCVNLDKSVHSEIAEAKIALAEEPVAWLCEHGNGSIELVLWPEARDRYASLGYEVQPLVRQ